MPIYEYQCTSCAHRFEVNLDGQTAFAEYNLVDHGMILPHTVVPPAFEREDVLVRGLGSGAAASLLRLVDPDSGEVLALRPDMTPQIARIVATHYRAAPMPVRLAYEGTVLRRARGRSRRHRQVAQAGGRHPQQHGLLPRLAEFVEQERQCCPFLQFTMTVEPATGPIHLTITGPEGINAFLENAFQLSEGR